MPFLSRVTLGKSHILDLKNGENNMTPQDLGENACHYALGSINIMVIITTKCQVLRQLLIKQIIIKHLLLASVVPSS